MKFNNFLGWKVLLILLMIMWLLIFHAEACGNIDEAFEEVINSDAGNEIEANGSEDELELEEETPFDVLLDSETFFCHAHQP